MSKNSKNSVKEPAEERTPAPQPKALNQTAIDPMYIGRLAGTLLGICLGTALLLGAVNQVTKPRIDAAQKAKTEAAMAGALGVELAGDAVYFGEVHHKPTLGDDSRPIVPKDILRANRLVFLVSLAAILLAAMLRVMLEPVFTTV